jgi:hypothetical protein
MASAFAHHDGQDGRTPPDRIRRVIGRIDTETSKQLDSALLVVLGLTR